MADILSYVARLGDKSGSFAAVIAAMECLFSFLAIASPGAAIEPGFLTRKSSLRYRE